MDYDLGCPLNCACWLWVEDLIPGGSVYVGTGLTIGLDICSFEIGLFLGLQRLISSVIFRRRVVRKLAIVL